MDTKKYYACIDLKSFYASVECVERGLDPFTHNLVVADTSRGPGAITLAITPAMKAKGIKNRCRLFEIPKGINYTAALPRMKLYMEYSARIYNIYLKYLAKEDIYIYSVDECFLYLTPYLKLYKQTPLELTRTIMARIQKEIGICSTGGIGENLFLAKVALDITAKHSPDNIGIINRDNFYTKIALHKPITDIWSIGQGTAEKLAKYGVYNLAGVAKLPVTLLKKLFGVNYRILLDHAEGRETSTIKAIKSYKPESRSLSTSQILFHDYPYYDVWQVIQEMVEVLTLEMIEQGLSTNHISLHIRYSPRTAASKNISHKLSDYTHSYQELKTYFQKLYFDNVSRTYLIRKIGIALDNLKAPTAECISLFPQERKNLQEDQLLHTVLKLKHRFGKNSIFRAASLQEHATALQRNKLIGGHNGEYKDQQNCTV